MRRFLLLVLVSVGAIASSAAPASAAPAVGGCAPALQNLDREGQIALAQSVFPDRSADRVASLVDAGIAAYDTNADGRLCVRIVRAEAQHKDPFAVLVDNVVPLR